MAIQGGWNDTIVALATAQGIGAIGVIRVSGPETFPVLNSVFPSKDLLAQPSHTLQVGYLSDGKELVDEVVLSLFKGPRSYTGEDVIEISCHGSPFIQEKIMHLLIEKGIRLAKPGEFTQRAFLNGKMDLTQAEAVADLIASNTEASRRAALHSMRGGFSNDLAALREELIRFSALIELELDFSQEDVAFADRTELMALINRLSSATSRLLQSFQLGNVIKNGVQVAIIGKPNAGKSTLLNALLNENRAIVSDIAGTTRDTIEEVINIKGVLFRLIDTAGIRSHTQDQIENLGMHRSLEKMRSANLVIYLFDPLGSSAVEVHEKANEMRAANIPFLLVGNKADLISEAEKQQYNGQEEVHWITALERKGIQQLEDELVRKTVYGDIQSDDTLVTNARHFEALSKLAAALAEVSQGLADQLPGDLLALDIRRCLQFLGEITGQITHENQLDFIFSKFCIGK
jgi:tRNA modification GTPase